MSLWRPSSIPRFTYTARRYTQVMDAYNIPSTTFVEFPVEEAGAPQPVIGENQVVLPEGFRNKDLFRIFTTTDVRGVNEGSSERPDLIFIFTHWYTVVKVHDWTYGVRSHKEVFLARTTDATATEV